MNKNTQLMEPPKIMTKQKKHTQGQCASQNRAKSLWKQEHPKANVPETIASHPELVDVSWHNDACPSFNLKGYEGGQKDFRLWVEYEDPTVREVSGENRYIVSFHDWDTNEGTDIYAGNDVTAAIESLKKAVRERG